ncbi:MAG: transposase family protein [Thermodesulfobacteriota bacterium]
MNPASAAVSSIHTTDCGTEHVLSPGELAEQARLLAILFHMVYHFFCDFNKVFSRVTDPRRPGKTTYSVEELAFPAIFMFMCGLKGRRQIGILLRHPMTHDAIQEVFRPGTCPHGDTLNDAFALMDPEEFQSVLCWMVFCLIRKKVLYPYRLLDRYYVVAIDGTWTLTRKTRHCPRCLTQTKNGKTTYYSPTP